MFATLILLFAIIDVIEVWSNDLPLDLNVF